MNDYLEITYQFVGSVLIFFGLALSFKLVIGVGTIGTLIFVYRSLK